MKQAPSTIWIPLIFLIIASCILASPSSYTGEVVDRYAEFLKRQARLPELKSQTGDKNSGGCPVLEGGRPECATKIETNPPPNSNDGISVDQYAELLRHQANQPINEVQCLQNRISACTSDKSNQNTSIRATYFNCESLSNMTSSSSTEDSEAERHVPEAKANPRSTPISIPPRKPKKGQPEKKMIPPQSFRKCGSEPFSYRPSYHALFLFDSLNFLESSDTI